MGRQRRWGVLGGASNSRDIQDLSTLIGVRDERTDSASTPTAAVPTNAPSAASPAPDTPRTLPFVGNALYYGDNLEVMRAHIDDKSVDLVYLDPPFNSNRSYNLLFKNASGQQGSAQIHAFDDTWHWGPEAERAYHDLEYGPSAAITQTLRALRQMLRPSDTLAYLVMMAPRLLEMRRVLKPTGSLYLHCDRTSSHYLKILLDAIFGGENFVNEIIWKRSSAHSDARQGSKHFGRISDTILFYQASSERERTWNTQFTPYDQSYIDRDYRRIDEDGRRYRLDNIQGPGGASKGNPFYEVLGVWRHWRYSEARMQELVEAGRIIQTRPGAVPQLKRYLDEMPGIPVQNIWTDIPVINNRSKEKIGYPTQKPRALLERIIRASSNPGDLVLDPFCGCGTAVDAAQRHDRRWIGIDISYLAIEVIDDRMRRIYGESVAATYEIRGIPVDVEGAKALAARDKFEFERWAVSLVQGQHEERRSSDRGVDGYCSFALGAGQGSGSIVISVKGGANNPGFVRDLIGTVQGHHADMGLMITLHPPTKKMAEAAATAGIYLHPNGQSYPRVQIITVEQLLKGGRPDWPAMIDSGLGTARSVPAVRTGARAGKRSA